MVEVWIDWRGLRRVGTLHRVAGRGRERVSFTYHEDWLADDDAFELSPAMPLGPGQFVPEAGQDLLAPLGDSSPDTWGRTVMRRYEGRLAEAEGRRPKTLQETGYLLGANDETRLGALRYKVDGEFQARTGIGVPALLSLGDLLQASQRVLRGEETVEDLQMLFAPGTSLGGARPKASILDQHGRLSVAKFPKDTDTYCVERWEAIALELARPLVFGAAVALAEDSPDTVRDVSAAKAAASDAALLAARAALRTHGAIGYTAECDLSHFLLRAQALHSAWGSPSAHRRRVLAAL